MKEVVRKHHMNEDYKGTVVAGTVKGLASTTDDDAVVKLSYRSDVSDDTTNTNGTVETSTGIKTHYQGTDLIDSSLSGTDQ